MAREHRQQWNCIWKMMMAKWLKNCPGLMTGRDMLQRSFLNSKGTM